MFQSSNTNHSQIISRINRVPTRFQPSYSTIVQSTPIFQERKLFAPPQHLNCFNINVYTPPPLIMIKNPPVRISHISKIQNERNSTKGMTLPTLPQQKTAQHPKQQKTNNCKQICCWICLSLLALLVIAALVLLAINLKKRGASNQQLIPQNQTLIAKPNPQINCTHIQGNMPCQQKQKVAETKVLNDASNYLRIQEQKVEIVDKVDKVDNIDRVDKLQNKKPTPEQLFYLTDHTNYRCSHLKAKLHHREGLSRKNHKLKRMA